MDRVRTFIAVLLDDATRAALAARVDRLRPLVTGIAWVAPENLHVTLKFLGGVDAPRLPLIQAALTRAAADVAPVELVVAGLGAFPTATRPRVIWAGIDAGGAGLAAVATAVDRELAGIGFPREERPFTGHVTLGRVREPKRNVALAEALRDGGRFGAMRLDRLAFMRSDLSPRGARYSELSSHPLGSSGSSVHG